MNNETVKTHENVVYVSIQTQTEQGIDVVCNLRTKFAEDGYRCIVVSNYEYSYLYNMEFIPKFVKETEVLAYLNKVFEVDLIILLDCEWKNWKIREDAVCMDNLDRIYKIPAFRVVIYVNYKKKER